MEKVAKMWLTFSVAVILGIVFATTAPLFPYGNNQKPRPQVSNCSEGKCASPQICASYMGGCQCYYVPPPWP